VKLLQKIANFLEILQFPQGLQEKIRSAAFCRGDWHMCRTLAGLGVRPRGIVDVGANIGQFALAAGHFLRPLKIVSVEPIPAAQNQLRKLILPPGIQFQPYELALAEQPGSAEFHVMTQSSSSSLLPLGEPHLDLYPQIREEKTIQVRVDTLDSLLKKEELPRPALLKLDVQGSELAVVRGCSRLKDFFQWILVEVSTTPFYQGGTGFEPLHEHLIGQGYHWLGPVTVQFPPVLKRAPSLQFDALYEKI